MAKRATKRNIWPFGKGQPLGSRSYVVKRPTGRRATPVSPREEKARERERMERKLSDPELTRKLRAHYSRGGSLSEFLVANPGSHVAVMVGPSPYGSDVAFKGSLKAAEKAAAELERLGYRPKLYPVAAGAFTGWTNHGKRLRGNPGASGSAFKRCVKAVSEKGGAYDPNAVCASQGRKKYGAKKYRAMALAGKKRAARKNAGDRPGYVKAVFENDRGEGERMWVKVTSAGPKGYTGTLDNDPAFKHRGLRRGSRVTVPYNRVIERMNPAEGAAAVYEEFHGMPSTRVTEVVERVHEHTHLAELGRLELLVVAGVDGYSHDIHGFAGAKLCSNEAKNQLFIRGGSQGIDLSDYKIKNPHEIETLGQVTEIRYFTDKKHLGSEGGRAIYFHKQKYGPDLIYRVRDKHLEFSGGEYEIKAEGIDK